MNDREQLTSRLENLGAEAGPPIDPAFANRLETDLRLAMLDNAEPSARPWWQPALVGVASLLMVLAAGLVFQTLTDDPSAELVMSAASDTEVILPGGNSADGVAGLELPDGSRISVGVNGQAVIDGVVLSPGSVAVVADGRLELLPTRTVSADGSPAVDAGDSPLDSTPSSGPEATAVDDQATRPTNSTTAGPSTTGSSSTSAPGSATTVVVEGRPTTTPTTTVGASTSTTNASSTSAPPTDRTTTAVTRPTTTTTTATSTTTTEVAEQAVLLDVTAIGADRLRLTWSVRGSGPEVLGYQIQVLAGERVRTILVVRDGSASTATVEQLQTGVGYRVQAVGADGEVLATSPAVRAP